MVLGEQSSTITFLLNITPDGTLKKADDITTAKSTADTAKATADPPKQP